MSDNVTLPGTGAVIATDEATDGTLGTVQFQYVKLVDGTLGGTTKVGASSNGLKVDGSAVTQPVSGTFWQSTQPVSAASLPLPTGAATSAKQPALGTAGTASSDVLTVQGIASMTALKVDASGTTVPVSGTFWQSTQPVSAASLPLPSGAATSAKQPAPGTAGTPSSDVLTVQGATSMTALKVDGSAVTQPISGTVTVQQGTASSLKVDLSGTAANSTAIKVDGSGVTQPVSGTVTASISSSTNAGATAKTSDYDTGAGTDTVTMFGIALPASGGAVQGGTSTNPLQVSLANTAANSTAIKVDGSGVTQPVSGTFWQSTQPISAASLPLPSGAATSAKQPALGTAGTAASDVITIQGIASMTAVKVDGSAVTQPVSGTFWQATQPVSGTVTVQQSTASSLKVDLSGTAANATAIKVDGSAVTQPVSGTVTANQGGAWTLQNTAGTSGGWSVNSQTGLTNTKVAVKSSAGNFGGYMVYNPNASAVYIQVFDVASGSVTLGTTAPTYVISLPASAAANVEFALGITHSTAITLAATTTATGSTAPGTALTGFFLYK